MYELIATSSFGLEAIVKRELNDLGLEVTKTDNGHIYFNGDAIDIARANINLRCADRVLINLKSFKAESFEELFDGIYELPWNDILDEDSNFIVEGRSHKSKLFSISDCQRITEKAIIKKLQMKHNISRFTKSASINLKFMLSKSLSRPGAMFLAINRASIGIVPEPQKGSKKGLSLL